MIYLLTAIALTPVGSSTVHFYIQTIHRTTQKDIDEHKKYTEQQKIRKSAGRAPSLRVLPWHCLTTEEKAWKNLSQSNHT